jgi:hypothetical protein
MLALLLACVALLAHPTWLADGLSQPPDLKALVGDYDAGSTIIKVRMNDHGHLTIEMLGQPRAVLIPGEGQMFDVEQAPTVKIEFRRDATGEVVDLVSHQLNGHVPALRIRGDAPTRDVLASFAGEYQVAAVTVTIRLTDDGKLTMATPGQPTAQLRHANGLRFAVAGVAGVSIEFRRDMDGDVTALVSHQLNGDVVVPKKA